MPSIYIINPCTLEPNYHTLEVLSEEQGGWAQVADLSIVTLAAFVPRHWDIVLTDEAISPVDFDRDADFVAITGKVTQIGRMAEISAEFRRRGRTVLVGGPYATLNPEIVRPYADVLVTGEIEDIAPAFFAELEAGTFRDRYDGGKADLRKSPLPRWDLYPVERAQMGALQTTRGCPFSCEFCDVIQYQGRKQRHKDIEQVLRELDALYDAGFRNTFLVDDNFTVHRKWAYSVLSAIVEWNADRADDPMFFYTQTSLDLVRDAELLKLCRAAGLYMLFMGVETVNVESLKETGKKQNLLTPMREAMERVVANGIGVHAGVIVGFDHDDPSIFATMKEFFYDLPVPHLGVNVLSAPSSTDLYRRLSKEGRLVDEVGGEIQGPFTSNIVPLRMTRAELFAGTQDLARWLYEPENYERRMQAFINQFEGPNTVARTREISPGRSRNFYRLVKYIGSLGAAEHRMVQRIIRTAARKPETFYTVGLYLGFYAQHRYFLAHHSRSTDIARSSSPAAARPASVARHQPVLQATA